MLPWNNELHYYDAAADRIVEVRANPGTPEFEAMWGTVSSGISKRISTRKDGSASAVSPWTSARPKPWMRRSACCAARLPGLGIAMADNHASYKRYTDLDDVCVQIDCRVADEDPRPGAAATDC